MIAANDASFDGNYLEHVSKKWALILESIVNVKTRSFRSCGVIKHLVGP